MISGSATDLDAKEGGVRAVVERLNTTLLDVMQSADTLGYRGRYEKLDPVLRSSFDFEFMAKIAVGRTWNGLDGSMRRELVERFSQMSIATFASRFDGYSGERFEIFGEKPGPRGTIVVDDRIVRPDDPAVGLNFVLKEQAGTTDEGGWRIVDVMLDGKFSELARQRAEFSAVLKNGGYDELIAALDERIADLGSNG
jgi:phospholipid transport system substrate-binding protein